MAFDAPAPTTADTITAAFRTAHFPEPSPANVAEMVRRNVLACEPLETTVERSVGECRCYMASNAWADFCGDLHAALNGRTALAATTSVKPVDMGAFWAAIAAANAREVRP